MFVSFSLKNCASFLEKSTLSMEATPIKSHSLSLIDTGKRRLLPVAAVYGANASGKTSLLDALVALLQKIVGREGMSHIPFLLKANKDVHLSTVELELLIEGKLYKYCIKVFFKEVYTEELYRVGAKKQTLIYKREFQDDEQLYSVVTEGVSAKDRAEINYVSEMEQDKTSLLLTALGKRGRITTCTKIYQYAKKATAYRPGSRSVDLVFNEMSAYAQYLSDEEKHERYLGFAQKADPIISRIEKHKRPIDTENSIKYDLKLTFKDQKADWDLTFFESDGTIEAIRLFPYIDDVLHHGGILIVDELEYSLHPLLMAHIVNLFTTPESNPGRGQLLFSTHNVLIMDKKYLRRDEIWFTEKDADGKSILFSLYDIEGVRSDRDYCKSYILGSFGAVPDQLFTEDCNGKTEE